MFTRSALMLLTVLVALGGCTQSYIGPKQPTGTVLGAVLGGLGGAQFGSGTGQLAATAAGALFGAGLGSEIGVSLDRADMLHREYSSWPVSRRQVPRPHLGHRVFRRWGDSYPMSTIGPSPGYGSWNAHNCRILPGGGGFPS